MQVDTSLRRYLAAASRPPLHVADESDESVRAVLNAMGRLGQPRVAYRVKIERRGNSYAAKIDRAAAEQTAEAPREPQVEAPREPQVEALRDVTNTADETADERAPTYKALTVRIRRQEDGGYRTTISEPEDRFEDRPANTTPDAPTPTCMMPAEAPPAEAPPAEAPPAENMFTVKISRQEGGGYSTTIRRS